MAENFLKNIIMRYLTPDHQPRSDQGGAVRAILVDECPCRNPSSPEHVLARLNHACLKTRFASNGTLRLSLILHAVHAALIFLPAFTERDEGAWNLNPPCIQKLQQIL